MGYCKRSVAALSGFYKGSIRVLYGTLEGFYKGSFRVFILCPTIRVPKGF